jgi:hypothetical protein
VLIKGREGREEKSEKKTTQVGLLKIKKVG